MEDQERDGIDNQQGNIDPNASADGQAGQGGAIASAEGQQPSAGAEGGAAGQDAGAAEATAGEANGPSEAAFVPRDVMEAQIRQIQSAKDREVMALRRELQEIRERTPNAPTHQQPEQQAGTGAQAAFDRNRMMELAEDDPGKAMEYLYESAVQASTASGVKPDQIRAAIREEMMSLAQEQAQLQAYGQQFDSLAVQANLTQEERQRALEIVQASMNGNQPTIPPDQAILQARFGDVSAAIQYANRGFQQAMQGATPQAAGANMGAPGQQNAPVPPKPPGPPPVPGAGQGNVQGQAAPHQQSRFTPAAARDALRI